MKKLSLFLLTFLCFQSACAPTYVMQTLQLSSQKYAPIKADSVRIFIQSEDLPAKFEKVAIIKTAYDSRNISQNVERWKISWEKAKAQAALLGCNGIYQKAEQSNTFLPFKKDSTNRYFLVKDSEQPNIDMFIAIRY